MTPTHEQFSGCLVGQCIGDALGAHVEGHDAEGCASWVDALRADLAGAIEDTDVGQYTDDSQLARELALSIVEHGRFDPARYAERVAAIFAQGRVVGQGLATARAAQRLRWGVPWHEAGEPAPNAGNGTAMRAAPAGLLHPGDHEARARVAHEQGYCTHQDPRASAGSVAVAGAVALAMRPGPLETPRFLAELAAMVAPFDEPFASDIRKLERWVSLEPAAAAAEIGPAGLEKAEADAQPYHWPGISPFVVPSVLWSLYAFLRSPGDFLQAVLLSILPGGDVDTTGAMTGAISGARLGLDRLPAALVERVHDDGQWRAPDLIDLACSLHRLATRSTPS